MIGCERDCMRCQTRSKLVIKEDRIDGILADCEELVGTLSSVNPYRNGGLLKVANKTYYLPDLPHNLLLRISELIGRPIGILRLADGYRVRVINTSSRDHNNG